MAQGSWRRSVHLLAAPSSPGEARRFVADAVAGILSPLDVDFMVLMTSEVVTNAVMHTGTPVDLVVRGVGRGGVQVEASDSGEEMPLLGPESLGSERGRGMTIVAALSDSWGVTQRPKGKTVWFRYRPNVAGDT